MNDKPNYITPDGYRRLREEYEALFAVERPRLVETISWAAGNGDRSELLCRRARGGAIFQFPQVALT